MDIYFIRHAESINNTRGHHAIVNDDSPLTEQGEQQGTSLSAYFHKQGVTHVYTSSQRRSIHTAGDIQSSTWCWYTVIEDLGERRRWVWWEETWQTVSKRLAHMSFEERYTFVPPQGESRQQMEQRLVATMQDIISKHTENDSLVIVTHKWCLRALLPTLLASDRTQHETYDVEVWSITHLVYGQWIYTLKNLNYTNHLDR